MLILTRRVGETIIQVLPDGKITETTVLGVKGNQVRMGVNADKSIQVHRSEIWDRIKKEKQG